MYIKKAFFSVVGVSVLSVCTVCATSREWVFGDSFEKVNHADVSIELTGQFVDSVVEGLRYQTSSGISGFTDSAGSYKYEQNDTVTFYIGDIVIGETVADGIITPYDFKSYAQISQFLQTLDKDKNYTNGIQIAKDLHNSDQFKKSLTPTEYEIQNNLNVKYFSTSDKNQQFINRSFKNIGLISRDIVVREFATKESEKAGYLKRIQSYWPLLYGHIIGDLGVAPLNSNFKNSLSSRVAYFFYFDGRFREDVAKQAIQHELINKRDLFLAKMEGAVDYEKRVREFSDSFVNLGGLITTVVQFVSDPVNPAREKVSKENKRKIISTVMTSGKNWVTEGAPNELLKEATVTVDSCLGALVEIPWFESISDVPNVIIKKVSKSADLVVNCAAGETIKATTRLFASWDLLTARIEFETLIIAHNYLDDYYYCGGNVGCMNSMNNVNYTRPEEHIVHALEENDYYNDSFLLREGIKVKVQNTIASYQEKVYQMTRLITDAIPSKISQQLNEIDYGGNHHLDYNLRLMNKEEDDNAIVLWIKLDFKNNFTSNLWLEHLDDLAVTIDGQSIKQVNIKTLSGDYKGDIFNWMFIPAATSKNDVLVPVRLEKNASFSDLSKKNIISISLDFPYEVERLKSGVKLLQKTFTFDLDLVRASEEIKEQQSYDYLNFDKAFITTIAGSTVKLPAVKLNGKVVAVNNVTWTTDTESRAKYPRLAISKSTESSFLTTPSLRSGHKSDVVVLKARLSDNDVIAPIPLVVNLVSNQYIDPPQKLSAFSVGDNNVELSWEAPRAESTTGYEVSIRKAGDDDFSVVKTVIGKAQTKTIIENLSDGTYYFFRIRTVAGTSLSDDYALARLKTQIPLSAPTAFAVKRLSPDSGRLSWSSATDPNTAGYEISMRKSGAYDYTIVKTLYNAKISHTEITELQDNLAYDFQIRTLTRHSKSKPSNAQLVGSEPSTAIPTKLNDTGITQCGTADRTSNSKSCSTAVANATGAQVPKGQDGHYGTGKNGSKGMSFSKISGYEGKCVQDNHTGLMWEVKQDSGLHSKEHTYSWYSTSNNNGSAGTQNGGTCSGSNCDTAAFVDAVNAAGWCGHNDWRLPTREELRSIVDYSRVNPAIDTTYFPNTKYSSSDSYGRYWSSSPGAYDINDAWVVYFNYGYVNYASKNYNDNVRLVRGGQ